MAAIGLAMHFTVALTATLIFYALSRRLAVLRTAPLWIVGPLYGVIVFCAMNYGTLPALSWLRSLYLHTPPRWPGSMSWPQLDPHGVRRPADRVGREDARDNRANIPLEKQRNGSWTQKIDFRAPPARRALPPTSRLTPAVAVGAAPRDAIAAIGGALLRFLPRRATAGRAPGSGTSNLDCRFAIGSVKPAEHAPPASEQGAECVCDVRASAGGGA